jgi:hypothetical protein
MGFAPSKDVALPAEWVEDPDPPLAVPATQRLAASIAGTAVITAQLAAAIGRRAESLDAMTVDECERFIEARRVRDMTRFNSIWDSARYRAAARGLS